MRVPSSQKVGCIPDIHRVDFFTASLYLEQPVEHSKSFPLIAEGRPVVVVVVLICGWWLQIDTVHSRSLVLQFNSIECYSSSGLWSSTFRYFLHHCIAPRLYPQRQRNSWTKIDPSLKCQMGITLLPVQWSWLMECLLMYIVHGEFVSNYYQKFQFVFIIQTVKVFIKWFIFKQFHLFMISIMGSLFILTSRECVGVQFWPSDSDSRLLHRGVQQRPNDKMLPETKLIKSTVGRPLSHEEGLFLLLLFGAGGISPTHRLY